MQITPTKWKQLLIVPVVLCLLINLEYVGEL